MAFTAPSAADLKTRFPAFTSVGDSIVDIALGEAALRVDDTWSSQDNFTLGQLLYAAHVLTLDGHGTGAEAKLASGGLLGYSKFKSGALEVERMKGEQSGMSMLDRTTYGQRFKELQSLNVSGPLVANC